MNLTNKEKLLTLTTNWLVITDVFLEGLLVLLSWITIIKSNMILSDTTAPTQSGNSGTGAPTTVTNDPTNGKKFRLPSMKGLFSR
jgi:hypothetical protein